MGIHCHGTIELVEFVVWESRMPWQVCLDQWDFTLHPLRMVGGLVPSTPKGREDNGWIR